MKKIKNYAHIIAACGPLGYLPAPGTMASLITMLCWFFISWVQSSFFLCCTLTLTICALWLINPKHDHSWIVIDEVVGMLFALYGLPPKIQVAFIALVLFRFHDIVKWGPMNWAEKLPGAAGILLDDCIAGIITSLFLHGYLRYVT